jgi:hypothetical protein
MKPTGPNTNRQTKLKKDKNKKQAEKIEKKARYHTYKKVWKSLHNILFIHCLFRSGLC